MWKAVVAAVGLLMWWGGPSSAAEADLPAATAADTELSHTITGRFVSYSHDDQEITLTDDNGEELIFTLEPDVVPRAGGRPVAFDQVQVGDRLTLTVADDENGDESVTALEVASAPAAPAAP